MALPASSTIPAFKAALRDTLVARAGLNGVQVSYGSPLPSPGAEFIWLADVEGAQEASALGRLRRREDLTLTVIVSVLRQSTDQEAATARAFALVAEIEDAFRDDPALDAHFAGEGQILAAQVTGPLRLLEFVTSDGLGRVAEVVVSVGWKSRI